MITQEIVIFLEERCRGAEVVVEWAGFPNGAVTAGARPADMGIPHNETAFKHQHKCSGQMHVRVWAVVSRKHILVVDERMEMEGVETFEVVVGLSNFLPWPGRRSCQTVGS